MCCNRAQWGGGALCLFDRVECPRGATGAGQDEPEGRSAHLLFAGTVPSVLEKKKSFHQKKLLFGEGVLDEGGRDARASC